MENILREKGLLLSGSRSHAKYSVENNRSDAGSMVCRDNSYAVQKMLMDLPTPSKPRPDMSSSQVSAAISNPNGIISATKPKHP